MRSFGKFRQDKNGAIAPLLGEIMMLFIVDLIGAALISPLADSIVGAQANITDAGADAMLGLVTLMFAVVLIVVNVVVIMVMVRQTSKKSG